MRIAVENLESCINGIFVAAGSRVEEARVLAEHLIGANLVGHDSHGVIRAIQYVPNVEQDKVRPNQTARAVVDTDVVTVIDGGRGYGQVIGVQAMEMGIEKCQRHGMAAVGIRNTGHLGRIGHWAELVAAAGLVSLHFVNTSGAGILVAPYGGREPRLSANPLAAGVPMPGRAPLILDMSTAAIAHGKISVALNAKTQLPDNCVIDHTGQVTRDPATYEGPPVGAILPVGGHKGSGLSVIIEVLAGALTGGHCSNPDNENAGYLCNNMFSLLLGPDLMGAGAGFGGELARLETWVKSSAPAVGTDGEILLPGEIEQRVRADRLKNGIPLDDETRRQLVRVGETLGVNMRPLVQDADSSEQ